MLGKFEPLGRNSPQGWKKNLTTDGHRLTQIHFHVKNSSFLVSLCQKPSFCVIARSGATKQSYNVLKIRRLPRTLRVLAMTKMGFGTASLWEREGNFPQWGDRKKMHVIFFRKTRFGYWMGLGKIKGEVKLGFGTWNLVFLCQDELY